jgi:hypothetical protein
MNENAMMKKMGRGMAKSAMAKKDMPAKGKMPAMKMGKVKTSPKPDGVATKGKTKGAMVKMAAGGLTKSEVKKADAAGRKVTKELKYDDMKDRGMKKMAKGGKSC